MIDDNGNEYVFLLSSSHDAFFVFFLIFEREGSTDRLGVDSDGQVGACKR